MTGTTPDDWQVDPASLAGRLHELVLDLAGLRSFLEALVQRSANQIAPSTSCGLTMVRGEQTTTVCSSDLRASQVDEIQYAWGAGPCLHAAHTQDLVVIDDIAADQRWPEFRARAMAHGVKSVLSVPLDVEDQVLAALNFYGSHAHTFAGSDRRQRAESFAAEAYRAIALAVHLGDRVELTEQMRAALSDRSTIDQAIGAVMAQKRCDAAEGFEVLRGAAQNRNISVSAVARSVLGSVTGPPASRAPTA